MAIKNTIKAEQLNALNQAQLNHIATNLGLGSGGTKDETVNAILAHQEGRCVGCTQNTLSSVQAGLGIPANVNKPCVNCGQK